LVPSGACYVQSQPIRVFTGLCSHRVAESVEVGNGNESGQQVELNELVLLLVVEGVEEAGFEA